MSAAFTTERRELLVDRRSTTSDPTVESLRAALADAAEIRRQMHAEIYSLRSALDRALQSASVAQRAAA